MPESILFYKIIAILNSCEVKNPARNRYNSPLCLIGKVIARLQEQACLLEQPSNHQIQRKDAPMKNALKAVMNYLKDWKNLLAHAIVGILILAVGLFLPVPPIYRIAILLLVISLNILRMRMGAKKAAVLE